MRIAMVGPFGFHPNKTMRSRAFQLARELVKRGHEVKLLMPPWHTPEQASKQWQESGVDISYVALNGGTLGITRNLIRETIAFKPDVVHCFKPKAYSGLVAWWLWYFRRHDFRLVVDTDDWEGRGGWNEIGAYSPLQKRFFAWQERWGLTHCHQLTVASRTLESLALANGTNPAQLLYLPNGAGIDADVSGGDARRAELGLGDRPVLLLYSRLFEFNTQRLLAILRSVHGYLPDLRILTVGSGLFEADATDLRDGLEEAGLLNIVVDTGWLEEAALPATIRAANVGLYLMDNTLLNRTKCPVKLADMVQSGLPVVGEDVGQVREYIRHNETGFVYPSGSVDAIAAGIIRILKDPVLRKRLGTNARQLAQNQFSWARLAEELEQAYHA